MTATALARHVLRVDAGANAALAAGVLALREPLTDAAGLAGPWPMTVLAVLLLANGALCWGAAGGVSPPARPLRRLAAVDALFAVAVLCFVVADPTGAATWLRAVLAGAAVVVAAVAAAKLLLAVRFTPESSAAAPH